MKKVLIAGSGRENSNDFYLKLSHNFDSIIGVDRGVEVLIKAGIKPDIAIGDFDSVSDLLYVESLEIKVLKFPVEKDKSDTELAIDFAMEKGFDEFVMTGMLGRRTDHLLFNISLLVSLYKQGKECAIIEEHEEIRLLDSEKKVFQVRVGDIISLFPIDKIVYGVSTEGLKYELQNKDLFYGSTLPLSNVALKNEISISIKKGTALVIIEYVKKMRDFGWTFLNTKA